MRSRRGLGSAVEGEVDGTAVEGVPAGDDVDVDLGAGLSVRLPFGQPGVGGITGNTRELDGVAPARQPSSQSPLPEEGSW